MLILEMSLLLELIQCDHGVMDHYDKFYHACVDNIEEVEMISIRMPKDDQAVLFVVEIKLGNIW